MANNYYGWNYGGVMDQFGGCYPAPPAYSMTQAVAYPNVPYSTPQYGPYGTIIANPVVQNVAIRGPTTGHPSCFQDGAQHQAGKSGNQRAGEVIQRTPAANTTGNSTINQTAGDAGDANVYQASYDAAVYNAARNFMEEKQTKQKKVWGGLNKDRFRSGRGPVIDPQQWKYCELCKCTCAGEQAYKAHLVGKAHKKKEVLGASAAMALAGSKGHMYCQLCEVSCSSSDAYEAHIKGAKHQKIMKVQMKMGKYVPDVGQEAGKTSDVQPKYAGGSPAILQSDCKDYAMDSNNATADASEEDKASDDPSVGPIGLEYITEMMNETNTAPMFFCKLCDCSFSDPLAKLMHSKGRRHRLQYKKKVDPTLKVDPQPMYNDRLKNQWRNKRKDSSDNYRQQAEALRYEKELLEWQLMKTQNPDLALHPIACSGGMPRNALHSSMATNSARDNQHVMAKHCDVYPTEDELNAVQEFVSTCERSLKMISDKLAAQDSARVLKGVMRVGLLAKGLLIRRLLQLELVVLTSEKPTKKLLTTLAEEMPEQIKTFSEREFKVTVSPDVSHLKVEAIKEEEVAGKVPDAVVKTFSSYNISCLIFVASSAAYAQQKALFFDKATGSSHRKADEEHSSTSHSDSAAAGLEEMQNEDECVDETVTEWALRELRRTKWFQLNSVSSPACSIVVRILMDFCRRIPTWTPIGQWALELLVEQCMSDNPQISPAAGLRRIFEVVSSGIFLDDGWGLADACRNSEAPVDAVSHLCPQEREDVTNSAQHALRLLAVGHINKVLGIAKLSPPPLMRDVPIKRPRYEDW